MNEALLAFLDREIIHILKVFHYNILNKNPEISKSCVWGEEMQAFAFANKEALSCLGLARLI